MEPLSLAWVLVELGLELVLELVLEQELEQAFSLSLALVFMQVSLVVPRGRRLYEFMDVVYHSLTLLSRPMDHLGVDDEHVHDGTLLPIRENLPSHVLRTCVPHDAMDHRGDRTHVHIHDDRNDVGSAPLQSILEQNRDE